MNIAKANSGDSEETRHHQHSTISPDKAEIGAQSPSNEHVDRLASILLTYNFYEKELGQYITTECIGMAFTSFASC